jgi:hypothetical protein
MWSFFLADAALGYIVRFTHAETIVISTAIPTIVGRWKQSRSRRRRRDAGRSKQVWLTDAEGMCGPHDEG